MAPGGTTQKSDYDCDQMIEILESRLNRLEIRLCGHGASPEELMKKVRETPSLLLWHRVFKVQEKLKKMTSEIGQTAVINQLEKELFSCKDFERTLPLRDPLLTLDEKATYILGKEEEIVKNIHHLKELQILQQYVDGPLIGIDADECEKRLMKLETNLINMEEVTLALGQEIEELLTIYDQVISMLSEKCIMWEEAILSLKSK